MTKISATDKRKKRIRTAIKLRSYGKPRLSVFRSNTNIYAQVIDDSKGITIVSASTVEKEISKKISKTSTVDAAKAIGELIAERAKKASVKEVVFDRGPRLYHGRVKALAEAARAAGLKF